MKENLLAGLRRLQQGRRAQGGKTSRGRGFSWSATLPVPDRCALSANPGIVKAIAKQPPFRASLSIVFTEPQSE